MSGGIYSGDKCPICGGRMVDNHRDSVSCPDHPGQRAKNLRIQFKGLNKRFKSYHTAQKTLTGWRYKVDEGIFDKRDYRKNNPLGFESLAQEWLNRQKPRLKYKSYMAAQRHILIAAVKFGNRNIKSIEALELADFEQELSSQYSSKYRHNIFVTMKAVYNWTAAYKIKGLEIPQWPEIEVTMAYRKPLTKDDQFRVLNEVKRIAPEKVYVAILWLATYPAIRPTEMQGLREGDIDLKLEKFIIPDHKTKKKTKGAKVVSMLPEDVELARKLIRSENYFLPFFRYPGKVKAFSNNILWKYWHKACVNLKIEGTSLYPGTKHTSIMALRKLHSPEKIRKVMQITSSSFDRYLKMDESDEKELFAQTRSTDVVLTLKSGSVKTGETQ